MLIFFIPLGNQSNASMLNVSKTNSFKKIIMKTSTLDLWNLKNNQKPDFIKCDTEGSELLVFRGGINMITKYTPMIYTELLRKWSQPYNYKPNDVINFFKKLGYSCYAIGKRRTKLIQKVDDVTVETNFIFLHTKIHSKVINKLVDLNCCRN